MSFRQIAFIMFTLFCFTLHINAQDEATAEPVPQSPLDQIITEVDDNGNMLTVLYPEGWIAIASNGQIQLGSSSPTLADFITQRPYDEGGTAGIIGAFPRDFLTVLNLPLDVAPIDLINTLQATLFAQTEDVIFADPIPITLNGVTGAMLRGITASDGTNLSVLFMVLSYTDSFVFVNFSAPEGELSPYEETIFAIAANVTYAGPELPESTLTMTIAPLVESFRYVDPELGTVSFTYPAGWVIDESNGVSIANTQTALDTLLMGTPLAIPNSIIGQIIISDVTSLESFGITPVSSALEVLRVFRNEALAGVNTDEPQTYLINDLEVASLRGTAVNAFGSIDLWFFMVHVNNGFILLSFSSLDDEMGQFEQTIFAIVGSIEYSALTN